MDNKELFIKNQQLSTEFELYLLEHRDLEDQIPDNCLIVLLPEYDPEMRQKNKELAMKNREKGQTIVYVKISKLRASRIESLELQVT